MANTLNFTKRLLDSLPPAEEGKRDTYHDTKTPGLTLRITSKGIKSFGLYRRIEGRPERITLGRFPQMTIEQARNEAEKLNGRISNKENPAQDRRTLRQEITLDELFELYLEQHAKVHKRSWKGDKAQYDRYLSRWASRKLSGFRKSDIQKLHASIGKSSPYAANRLLALISSLFNKAADWGWKGDNPAHGVKKFKEQSRDRFLEADELPRFFESLAQEPNQTARDYFLVSLLTGARKDNVLCMRWDQINIERATWTIPDTKSGEPHTVPLIPAVVELLEDRKREEEKKTESVSGWVFPGTGKTGHLVEPKKAWKRILERAEIENLRIHDLRRSLGSWQAATGANLSIIGKTLAHKNVSTTAIYARLNLDPVRESMKKAGDAIFEAGGILPRAGVLNIKK